jgi:HAD superfamily hydrolase (TIGR01450 family)
MPAARDFCVYPQTLGRAYVFDLDATLYLGDELLPGAKRLIDELRRREIPLRFLSNYPNRSPEGQAAKLCRLGLGATVDEVTNPVVTTVRWLLDNYPDATVFPIAEEPLLTALRDAGIHVSDDPEQVDIVIASYDRGFDYRKLQIAFDAIWLHKRAFLVETNPDLYCPLPGGGEPDTGAIAAAIETCTGTRVQVNLGKPNPLILEVALAGLDLDPADCVMVGDRLHTDMQMALDTGMRGALVLTGETTVEDVAQLTPEARPRYILDRVDRLMPAAIRAELGW